MKKTYKTISLSQFAFFAHWPKDKADRLLKSLSLHHFADGQTIFETDDKNADIYFILQGGAKSIVYGYGGRLSYFRLRKSGELFGYYSALTGEPRTATMTAVGPTVLARMKAKNFLAMLEQDGKLATKMLDILARLLRTETKRIATMTTMSAEQRLCVYLLQAWQDHAAGPLNVPGRFEIGSHVGLARETVSRLLNKLAKRGVVRLQGWDIYMKKPKLLESIINEDT